MVEHGAAAAVQGPRRGQVRCIDAEFAAQVTPERRRHDAKRVEHSTAHAQEPDVHGQAELVGVATVRADQRALGRAEGAEGLQLEAADVAWQLVHAQVRGLSASHRAPHLGGPSTIRHAKVNSNPNQINNLPIGHRAVVDSPYRHLLH